jgi:hypothetical protein
LIDSQQPMLFIGEIDTVLGFGKASSEQQEALRVVFNEGFQPDAQILRRAGSDNETLESYAIFCAKAFAAIGLRTLPETVQDRSIIIRLERKSTHQKVARIANRRERRPRGRA